MYEISFIDVKGRRRSLEVEVWTDGCEIARRMAVHGCGDVRLFPIRKDFYLVDPDTWDRYLVAANILLSEVGELSQWWCEKYRNYGLAILPAKKPSRAKRFNGTKKKVG